MHMLVVIENAHPIARAKLKLSQLFECDGINGIEWRIANSKLSYELELGGIYRMMYARYIHAYIDRGDAVWQVWCSLRLTPIILIEREKSWIVKYLCMCSHIHNMY